MSRIDHMVREMCPDGVQQVPLGTLGTFTRGSGLQKSSLTDSGVPAIHYGQIHTRYGLSARETISFVPGPLAQRLRHARPGDLVIATTSEDDDAVGKATAWLGTTDAVVSGDAYIYHHDLDPEYVSHFFTSASFHHQKTRFITGAKVRRISGNSLEKIVIPAPPLEVQHKIAMVLNSFKELEAELEARRVQFIAIRDQILAASKPSPDWLPLSAIGRFKRGRRFNRRDLTPRGIPCIHYGDIYTNLGSHTVQTNTFLPTELKSSLRFAEPGDIVLTDVGETVDDVGKATAWIGDEPAAIHDHCFAFCHTENPRYLSHVMASSTFIRQKRKYVARTKVKTLSMDGLAKVLVPLPDAEAQNTIADLLDGMESLISDISTGLPAEIAARRRQYEYYRDKLLTFPQERS